jgi:CheY-like chemotaxis protein
MERDRLEILCAEDNGLLGEILVQVFTRAGHGVAHVADGQEAWSLLSSNLTRFDVLVTDHQMPGFTGLRLAELLRKANYAGRIVVYSSSLSLELIAAYQRWNVEAFVPKSSRADALLRAVEGSHLIQSCARC